MTAPLSAEHGASHDVTLAAATRVWAEIALKSFGGPAGQIAVMHRILVEERRWISEARFLHALNYCMLLPGPEAQQLAVYVGWLLHGYKGGLIAGGLFVLPGFSSILLLSFLYAQFRGVAAVEALLFGVKAAVLAVVLEAVLRIGKRVAKTRTMIAVAVAAFTLIFFFEAPFPAIVLGAGVLGYVGGRRWPGQFVVLAGHGARSTSADDSKLDAVFERGVPAHVRPSLARAARVAGVCLTLWAAPLVVSALLFGAGSVFFEQGVFFSKAAVVTFGGAYAVLAYIAQQAVERYGWLQPGEMLDGLGMAETTPGPLIMVVQFVAFMGAYRHPGTLDPLAAGVLGSVVTTWVTFVPCFLWIFLGAPYVEVLRGRRELTAALSTITAAVVGVIANLAVWFALHVVFRVVDEWQLPAGLRLLVPQLATVDVAAFVLGVGAFVAMFRFKVGMLPVLGASAALGMIYKLAAHRSRSSARSAAPPPPHSLLHVVRPARAPRRRCSARRR